MGTVRVTGWRRGTGRKKAAPKITVIPRAAPGGIFGDMTIPQPITWTPDFAVRILDQTLLPDSEQYLVLDTVDAVAEAIRTLRVRGAPLIGIAAAMGVTLAYRGRTATLEAVCAASAQLGATRPTAVNLHWALSRMERRAAGAAAAGEDLAAALRTEATAIWDEDRAMCARIGVAGAALIEGDATVLTHCNAGALATGGMGTALAPIYTLHEAGLPVTVITDGMAASRLRRGDVTCVLVGADRIAANGDVANKIGTYGLALAAKAHGIPFYVAAPTSTVDLATPNGAAIPIEERAAAEVSAMGGRPTAPADA